MVANAYPVAPYRGGQRRQGHGSSYQDSRGGRRKTPNRLPASGRRMPKLPNASSAAARALASSTGSRALTRAALFGLKGLTRFIPGVGWGLLALDVLSLGLAYYPRLFAWLQSQTGDCTFTCKGSRIINFHSCAQEAPTPCEDLMSLLNNSATLRGPVTQRFVQGIEWSNPFGPTASEWFRGQRYDRLLGDGSLAGVPRSAFDSSHMAPSTWFDPSVVGAPKPGMAPAPSAPQWADPFGPPAPGVTAPSRDPRPSPHWARPYKRSNRYRSASERHESGPTRLPGPNARPGRPRWSPGGGYGKDSPEGFEKLKPYNPPGTGDTPVTREPPPRKDPQQKPRLRRLRRPSRPGGPSMEPDDYPLDAVRSPFLELDDVPTKVEWQVGGERRLPPLQRVRREPIRPSEKPRQKQNKYRTRTYAIARGLLAVVNSITEAKDVSDALFDALPASIRLRTKRKTAYLRAKAVYTHFHRIDVPLAFRNIVANQIEDFLYGNMGRISRRSSRNLGHDFDIHGRNARILDLDPVSGVLESVGLSL